LPVTPPVAERQSITGRRLAAKEIPQGVVVREIVHPNDLPEKYMLFSEISEGSSEAVHCMVFRAKRARGKVNAQRA
jgi:hypothetical protein